MSLSDRSRKRLQGIHPHLVRVVKRAAETPGAPPFVVIEGLRTAARQAELVERGASRTMNSRHLTGHAVDIAPLVHGRISWDWSDYYPLADAIKAAAKAEGVPVEWGGDWRTFKDGPHWQLPRRQYPGEASAAPVTDGVPERAKKDAAVKIGGGAAAGVSASAAIAEAVAGAEQGASFFSTDNPVMWVIGTLVILGLGYVAWRKWRG